MVAWYIIWVFLFFETIDNGDGGYRGHNGWYKSFVLPTMASRAFQKHKTRDGQQNGESSGRGTPRERERLDLRGLGGSNAQLIKTPGLLFFFFWVLFLLLSQALEIFKPFLLFWTDLLLGIFIFGPNYLTRKIEPHLFGLKYFSYNMGRFHFWVGTASNLGYWVFALMFI